MIQTGSLNNKQMNTGISILRLFLCFEVFYNHYSTEVNTIPKMVANVFRGIPVPCFIFLTFYLTCNMFDRCDREWICKRYKRLLYPIWFWSFIYYPLMCLIRWEIIPIRQLIYSCLFGSSSELAHPLWYLAAETILLTVFYVLFSFGYNKKTEFVLAGIGVFCLLFVWSEMNFNLFNGAPYESVYTLGRTAEIMPMAVLGFFYGKYSNKISSVINLLFIMLAIIFFVIFSFFIHIEMRGFGYHNIKQNLLAIIVVLAFINLPNITTHKIAQRINYIAKFTMGAYCMQVLVCSALLRIWGGMVHYILFDVLAFASCLWISYYLYLKSDNYRLLRYMVV